MNTIERLILPPNDSDVSALALLLADTVQTGAAVSFLATLTMEGAEDWWRKTLSTSHPAAIFLVARDVEGIVGTVQLHPAWAPNQPHRAEIAKLLVHRRFRRAGLATQLMETIENEAKGAGFSLLTLDTKRGCAAEHLYRKLGWIYVGTIPRFAVDPDGATPHDDLIFYKELRGHELIPEPGPKHPGEVPCSAFERTGGIVYFARMLDKIRRHAAGTLRADFHPNLGFGFDGRCCRFLGVEYSALRQRVLAGGNDDDLLAWCSATGTHPNDEQILVWNKFMLKRGWRDEDDGSSQELESYKASSGFAQRSDLLTFFDFYEVDEGRNREPENAFAIHDPGATRHHQFLRRIYAQCLAPPRTKGQEPSSLHIFGCGMLSPGNGNSAGHMRIDGDRGHPEHDLFVRVLRRCRRETFGFYLP